MMKSAFAARRRTVVIAGSMVAALGLAACQEQQGTSTTPQARQNGSAIVQTAHAAGQGARQDAEATSAARLDAYLARIRREARENRQQALQMRQQVIAYKEAVQEARVMAAKYKEDILRIRADIARERSEMEKHKAEIDALLKDISAQAARIRADRDYIRQLAGQTDQAKKQIALIRQSIRQMRDDLLPKAALTTSSVSALRQPSGNGALRAATGKSADSKPAAGKSAARPVTGLSLSPAANQPASGSAAVKVRVPQQER